MSKAPRPITSANRNRELARIHCLKRDLTLTDEEYSSVLWTLARVESAKDLDATGRHRVIRHLTGLAERSRIGSFPGKPRNFDNPDRDALMRKIEALLTDAGRPWAYAKGMATHMFKRDALEFCGPDELYKIVQALEVDKKRREAKQ